MTVPPILATTNTNTSSIYHPMHSRIILQGAFLTIDRPYEKLFFGAVDFLHHKIGSTHVLHHIDCTIPHYNARRATEAIKNGFPKLYLKEDTPIFEALWRVATKCYQGE